MPTDGHFFNEFIGNIMHTHASVHCCYNLRRVFKMRKPRNSGIPLAHGDRALSYKKQDTLDMNML